MKPEIGVRYAFGIDGSFFSGVVVSTSEGIVHLSGIQPYRPDQEIKTIGVVVRHVWQLMTIVQ